LGDRGRWKKKKEINPTQGASGSMTRYFVSNLITATTRKIDMTNNTLDVLRIFLFNEKKERRQLPSPVNNVDFLCRVKRGMSK